MPTMRLGNDERSHVIGRFSNILSRLKNHAPFPLAETDFPMFGIGLLEPAIADHYQYLMQNAMHLISRANWHPSIKVSSAEKSYEIRMNTVWLPQDYMEVPVSHPEYAAILAWALQQEELKNKREAATKFLVDTIYLCSSAGQIKRVLSEEVMHFVPDYLTSTFEDAERQSRVPRGLYMNDEYNRNILELAELLALGSLCPRNQPGLEAILGEVQVL